MVQLGGAPLESVESSDWPLIMRLQYIGNKAQENSGRQIGREIKGEYWEIEWASKWERKWERFWERLTN